MNLDLMVANLITNVIATQSESDDVTTTSEFAVPAVKHKEEEEGDRKANVIRPGKRIIDKFSGTDENHNSRPLDEENETLNMSSMKDSCEMYEIWQIDPICGESRVKVNLPELYALLVIMIKKTFCQTTSKKYFIELGSTVSELLIEREIQKNLEAAEGGPKKTALAVSKDESMRTALHGISKDERMQTALYYSLKEPGTEGDYSPFLKSFSSDQSVQSAPKILANLFARYNEQLNMSTPNRVFHAGVTVTDSKIRLRDGKPIHIKKVENSPQEGPPTKRAKP